MNDAFSFTTSTLDVTNQTGGVSTNAIGPVIGTPGYDALEPKGRRKSPGVSIVREDTIVSGGRRVRLQANANDIARNFTIAAWAIRRHLDYVARFNFHARNKDRGLNRDIEELMRLQSTMENCDRGGKFTRERYFRLAEARRVLDGDFGTILLQDGRMQAIEADLIRNPEKQLGPMEWIDGIQADYAGKAIQYSIWSRPRGGVGYSWKRNVSAQNFIHYGFFERSAADQFRGISPIVASLNNYRDVYEKIDYALVKGKIEQLFAIALSRDADATPLDEAMPGVDGTNVNEAAAADETEDEQVAQPRSFDLSHGPTVLDLDPGEKVDVIESKNPSNEFQTFVQFVVMIALKALDIPYSFFNESFTNYSGQRSCRLHYERSTLTNRDDQIEMRNRWTDFQTRRWVMDGLLKLPSRMRFDDLKYEWVPLGMPWWKPSEEIVGDLKAIASGLDSPINIVKARGTGDIHDNIDDLIEVIKYARDRGMAELGEPLRLNFDPGPFPSAILSSKQDSSQ